jgi:hypothetical protein
MAEIIQASVLDVAVVAGKPNHLKATTRRPDPGRLTCAQSLPLDPPGSLPASDHITSRALADLICVGCCPTRPLAQQTLEMIQSDRILLPDPGQSQLVTKAKLRAACIMALPPGPLRFAGHIVILAHSCSFLLADTPDDDPASPIGCGLSGLLFSPPLHRQEYE